MLTLSCSIPTLMQIAVGPGKTFDWSLAKKAQELLTPPIILSGGLHPENVAEAIRQVQPYAVDVASGVESEPGKKDREKLRKFIEAVKARNLKQRRND